MVGTGLRLSFNPPWLAAAVSLIWILAVVNAVNFVDNMNGLCAGLCVIAALALGCHLHAAGQPLPAAVAFLASGAALGSRPWNYPKATAFLGDAGSHGAGMLLATLSLLLLRSREEVVPLKSLWGPVLILGVPLLDLGWVTIRRTWAGQPVYVGDRNHLSHRLVAGGLRAWQAVAVLWAIGIALSSLAWLSR